MKTAAASPKPINLMDRRSATMKLANTHTMIAAAAVMTLAVADNPSSTAPWLSRVSS